MADGSREVTIERLGAQGDGVAAGPKGPLHVPRALPGETFAIAADGGARLVSAPSPDRRAVALCPHFPGCGGCTVQHMSEALYGAWKDGLLGAALAARGLTGKIGPMVRVPQRSRRRAVLSATRGAGAATLGYHGLRSHAVLPIRECAVLAPQIVAALPGLEALLGLVLPAGGQAKVTVLAGPHGLDVTFDGPGFRTAPDLRAEAAARARALGIRRLVVARDIWLSDGSATVVLSGIAVRPPPGAFLQACAEAEQALVGLVRLGVGTARRIVDLYAGLGTFALPLATRARVTAIDSDRRAIAALAEAARATQGLKPIATMVRDLHRTPLTPPELEAFEAAVLDPPFAGAHAQAEALARSTVRTVIAVSCNPATLARDLRILVDGGYRIERVTPVDQFLYSHHLEAVAVLTRARR